MQNTTNGRSMNNADPFFRSNPGGGQSGMGSMNWNTEAASSVGASGSIGTKDLSIIQDEMHSEALLYKKCTVYAGYFNDPQLKSLASTAAEHHRRHFETLHGYLTASK